MNANGRRRCWLRPGGAAAVVAVSTALACGDVRSRSPVSPRLPSVAGLEISGPESVAPGQTVQFRAHVRLSDGTLKQPRPGTVFWVTSDNGPLEVSGDGVATGREAGQTRIFARFVEGPQSSRDVVVVPEGTFRMLGRVVEIVDEEPAGAPVPEARVEVVGLPLQTITNANGEYRLFGVPADAEVRVTAPGYSDHVEAVHLTAHATRDFTIVLSAPRLRLEGDYRLAVDVDGCSGPAALPAELQHRVYDALLRQTGGVLEVLLTEPRFLVTGGKGNHFRGLVDATGVRLRLQPFVFENEVFPDLTEALPDGSALVIGGDATLRGTPSLLDGDFQGDLSTRALGGPFGFGPPLSACASSGGTSVRMTLSQR